MDNRQSITIPKLLLFDEIDAPLHPSMSRQLVDTIQNSLVDEQGIKVIMATHSPSTIAVVPDSSVYVMDQDGDFLSAAGKQRAISLLTKEIPTLSIDYSGRRQVFVESNHDARRYDELFRLFGGELRSERSLSFISAGSRGNAGDVGGGCANVIRMVNALVESGNQSVFGLIDWDGVNASEGRIVVVAENTRYSIENCILDPVLVGCVVTHVNREHALATGLPVECGYANLGKTDNNTRQQLADRVVRRVLELDDGDDLGEQRSVEYIDGTTCDVATAYLEMNGHDLEAAVKAGFPVLNAYHNTGELLMRIIDPILFDFPTLAPREIIDTFEAIQLIEINN